LCGHPDMHWCTLVMIYSIENHCWDRDIVSSPGKCFSYSWC
jgi:hypothetical protein